MDIYTRYAEITNSIAALEEQQALIRKQIESSLPDEGYKDDKVTAFWSIKKKWVYPEKVIKAEEVFKTEKKLSESDGSATSEEIRQLTIKVK